MSSHCGTAVNLINEIMERCSGWISDECYGSLICSNIDVFCKVTLLYELALPLTAAIKWMGKCMLTSGCQVHSWFITKISLCSAATGAVAKHRADNHVFFFSKSVFLLYRRLLCGWFLTDHKRCVFCCLSCAFSIELAELCSFVCHTWVGYCSDLI